MTKESLTGFFLSESALSVLEYGMWHGKNTYSIFFLCTNNLIEDLVFGTLSKKAIYSCEETLYRWGDL